MKQKSIDVSINIASLLSLLLFVSGYLLLFNINWRIGLGVLLGSWASDITAKQLFQKKE